MNCRSKWQTSQRKKRRIHIFWYETNIIVNEYGIRADYSSLLIDGPVILRDLPMQKRVFQDVSFAFLSEANSFLLDEAKNQGRTEHLFSGTYLDPYLSQERIECPYAEPSMMKNRQRFKWSQILWALKICAVVVLTGFFIFQTVRCISLYTNRKRVLLASPNSLEDEFTFPVVTLCPYVPFNTGKLVELGLTVPVDNADALLTAIKNLDGIDVNLTNRELQRFAGWNLGSLLEETLVGDISEVYDLSANTSVLWMPSFRFLIPCFSLKLQSAYKKPLSVLIKPRKNFGLKPCTWYSNGREKYYKNSRYCPEINQYCNTSCSEEELLYYNGYRITGYLESTTKRKISYRQTLVDYEIKPESVELEQHRVKLLRDNEVGYDAHACLQKCLADELWNKASCRPNDYIHHEYPLSNICLKYSFLLENDLLREYGCANKCPPEMVSNYWKIYNSMKSSFFSFTIGQKEITSTQESETYPLEKLLSDIGGNLGLLLGFSLLSLSLDIYELIFQTCSKLKIQKITNIKHPQISEHSRMLFKYTVNTFLLLFTSVNFIFLFQSYIQQYECLTVVVRKRSYWCPTSNISDSSSLQDWIYGYFSSHSLGCKVIPPDEHTQCLQKCTLYQYIENDDNLLPYIFIENLPPCVEETVPYWAYRYNLPESIFSVGVQEVENCLSQCEQEFSSNCSYHEYYPIPRVEPHRSMSLVQLICNIGGVIGLYIGISFLDTHALIFQPFLKRVRNLHSISLYVKMILCCILGILAATICLQQVYICFNEQPIYTSTNKSTLIPQILPAMTMCPWPPKFNHSFILDESGGDNATDLDIKMFFQKLFSNKSDLAEALTKLWELEDKMVCENYGGYFATEETAKVKVKESSTLFGKCFTCSPRPSLHEFITEKNLYCMKTTKSGIKPIFFQIHDQECEPFWARMEFTSIHDDFNKVPVFYIESLDRFRPASLAGTTYGICMRDCQLSEMSDSMDLNSLTSKPNNTTLIDEFQYLEFLNDLWQKQDVSSQMSLDNFLWTSECERHCRNSEFLSMHMKMRSSDYLAKSALQGRITWDGPEFGRACIQVNTEFSELREEAYGYSPVSLLSDIGGVASFTIGVSLMSMLFMILNKIKYYIM